MTRRWRLGAFGLVIAVVAVVAVSPASAVPPAHEKSTQAVKIPERYRKQIPLIQAADVIRAEIDRGDYPGYAGIELQDAQVAVWWKGAVPEPVGRAIDNARSIALVRVGAAAHSLRELKAAGVSIQAVLTAEQPDIEYAVDGSRIIVDVHDRAAASRQMPQVDVPVEIVDRGTKHLTSRNADWAPWSGGARI
jgi:streptogrisin D